MLGFKKPHLSKFKIAVLENSKVGALRQQRLEGVGIGGRLEKPPALIEEKVVVRLLRCIFVSANRHF